MIDNFKLAYNYIDNSFAGKDTFFLVEILKRKKENTYLKKDIVLKRFYVKTSDDLKRIEDEVKKYAAQENARVIFHVNEKSEKRLAFDLLKAITARIEAEDYSNIHHLTDSLIASQKSMYVKKWLIDVDKNNMTFLNFQIYKKKIKELVMTAREDQEVIEFPTPNGVHLIVNPFNSEILWDEYPDVIIHKNHATVLFADTHIINKVS